MGAEQEGRKEREVTAFKPQRARCPGQASRVTTARSQSRPPPEPRRAAAQGQGDPCWGRRPWLPSPGPARLCQRSRTWQPAWAGPAAPQRKPGEGAAWGSVGELRQQVASAQLGLCKLQRRFNQFLTRNCIWQVVPGFQFLSFITSDPQRLINLELVHSECSQNSSGKYGLEEMH